MRANTAVGLYVRVRHILTSLDVAFAIQVKVKT